MIFDFGYSYPTFIGGPVTYPETIPAVIVEPPINTTTVIGGQGSNVSAIGGTASANSSNPSGE